MVYYNLRNSHTGTTNLSISSREPQAFPRHADEQTLGLHHGDDPVTEHQAPKGIQITSTSRLEKTKQSQSALESRHVSDCRAYLANSDENCLQRWSLVLLRRRLALQHRDYIGDNDCHMATVFAYLLLLFEVNDIAGSEDAWVGWQLQCGFDLDVAIFG